MLRDISSSFRLQAECHRDVQEPRWGLNIVDAGEHRSFFPPTLEELDFQWNVTVT